MKVDRQLQMKLAENLEWRIREFSREYRLLVKRIQEAGSVEEIMELKQEILSLWAQMLPLGGDYCYFCLLLAWWQDCQECLYGKVHGICSEAGSDFQKIQDKRATLLSEIENYCKGERYDNDL